MYQNNPMDMSTHFRIYHPLNSLIIRTFFSAHYPWLGNFLPNWSKKRASLSEQACTHFYM